MAKESAKDALRAYILLKASEGVQIFSQYSAAAALELSKDEISAAAGELQNTEHLIVASVTVDCPSCDETISLDAPTAAMFGNGAKSQTVVSCPECGSNLRAANGPVPRVRYSCTQAAIGAAQKITRERNGKETTQSPQSQMQKWIALVPTAGGAVAIVIARLGNPFIAIIGVLLLLMGIVLFAMVSKVTEEIQNGTGKFWKILFRCIAVFAVLCTAVVIFAALPVIIRGINRSLESLIPPAKTMLKTYNRNDRILLSFDSGI